MEKKDNKQGLITRRVKDGLALAHGAVEPLCIDLLEGETAISLSQSHHVAKCHFTQKHKSLSFQINDETSSFSSGWKNRNNKQSHPSCCSDNNWLLCCTCLQSKL